MRIDVPTHVVARKSRDCGEAFPFRKNGECNRIGENPISGDGIRGSNSRFIGMNVKRFCIGVER
jgi:hypothetical protein